MSKDAVRDGARGPSATSLPRRSEYLPFGRPDFSEEEIAAVTRVLRSGWVGMGPETIAFEQELSASVGAPHVVSVSSCTAALFLSLLVEGVAPADEVVCPSLTWCSSANAALYLGAKPVFCDVDPETLCATPEAVLSKLSSRTKAVVVVHFGGLAVDVRALRERLPERTAIVEDAAHAFGAHYPDGGQVGSSGNLTCFSFYANKNLSTGEGGAVALFGDAAADQLRSLRQHGLPTDAWKRFTHAKTVHAARLERLGYKMNYTDLQAALGRVQLRRQAAFSRVRSGIAHRYHQGLSPLMPPIGFQQDVLATSHARHLFVIRLPVEQLSRSRDELLLELRARNLGASVHYDPLHLMPLYGGRATNGALPQTESLAERIMTLPISASMSLADADEVVEALAEAVSATHRPGARPSEQD